MQLPLPPQDGPMLVLDPYLVNLVEIFLFSAIVYFVIEIIDTFVWWIKEGRR